MNSAGRRVFSSGQAYGSEPEGTGFVIGRPGEPTGGEEIADGFLGYLAFPRDPGPDFTWEDFDFDRHPKRMRKLSAPVGCPRAGAPPLSTVRRQAPHLPRDGRCRHSGAGHDRRLKRLASRMGGLRATQRFARLFVIPGMAHCSLTGLGVNRLDPITAITDWVQSGQAPGEIVAWTESDDGKIVRRMPTYPFPLVPRYKGSGAQRGD